MRRVDSRATCILTEPHLSSRVGSEALWAMLLVGFWCEDICHMGSPDSSSGRDRTYPWNLVHDTIMATHLVERVTGWSVGPGSDSMIRSGLHQGRVT
jgi:hypothetical protein